MRTYNNSQREDWERMDFATLVKNHHTTMIILNPNDKYKFVGIILRTIIVGKYTHIKNLKY